MRVVFALASTCVFQTSSPFLQRRFYSRRTETQGRGRDWRFKQSQRPAPWKQKAAFSCFLSLLLLPSLLLCMPAFSTCVLSSSFHLPFLCCYLFSFSFLPFHFSFLTPAVPTTAVGLRISASGASASVPFPATPLPSSHQESMRTCRSSLQVQCSFSHFLVIYSSLIAYASIQHNQHN